MKKILSCFVIILFSIIPIFSQQKSFDVVIGSGFYFAKKDLKNSINPFYSADFEFDHSEKVVFSAGLVYGRYKVFDEKGWRSTLSGVPFSGARQFQFNFLAKYKVFQTQFKTLQVGAGLGLFIENTDQIITTKNGATYLTTIPYHDIGLPITLEYYKTVSKHISIGIKAGTVFKVDYDFDGNNIGLQMRYSL